MPALDAALEDAADARPDLASPLERLAAALDDAGRVADALAAAHRSGDGEGRRGPGVLALRAAGVARRGRRAARARPGVPTRWPRCTPTTPARPTRGRATLLAGTTHDVGARRGRAGRRAGAGRTGRGRSWRCVDAWADGPGAALDVDPAMQWFALQTRADDARHSTSTGCTSSSSRRRGRPSMHTSWTDQHAGLRGAAAAARRGRCSGGRRPSSWPRRCERPGAAISLAMLAVRLTAPGVADLYQGTEAFRYVLVDPDNRAEPDHAALDALVDAGGDAGRPGGVGRGRRAGRASGRRSAGCSPPAGGSTSPATSRSTPAPTSLAFARTDAAGDPVLVTIVPARRRGRRHRRAPARPLAPRPRSTTSPTPRARSTSTPRSPPSRPSSCARLTSPSECLCTRVRPAGHRTRHSDAASTRMGSAGEEDGGGAGDGEGAVVEDGRRAVAAPLAVVGVEHDGEAGGVDRAATVGSAPKPSTSSDRSPSRRRSTTTVSPWQRDGLLGVAAQHADAAAQGEQLGVGREHACGAARSAASDGSSTAPANVAGSPGSATSSVHSSRNSRRRPSRVAVQQLLVAVVDEERERRRLGVLLAHEQHRRERRQQRRPPRRRGAGARSYGGRAPAGRVADVVVVAREHDEALERQRRRPAGRGVRPRHAE